MNVQISRPLSSVSPAGARALVRIVIVGHVDHGKSTLIGRLLHETDGLPDGKLDALKAVSARRGMPFEWSFLLDALQTERDQGITIDTSQIRLAHRGARYRPDRRARTCRVSPQHDHRCGAGRCRRADRRRDRGRARPDPPPRLSPAPPRRAAGDGRHQQDGSRGLRCRQVQGDRIGNRRSPGGLGPDADRHHPDFRAQRRWRRAAHIVDRMVSTGRRFSPRSMRSRRHASRTTCRRACRCKPSTSSTIAASLPDAWRAAAFGWVTMSSSCRPASPPASSRSRHGRCRQARRRRARRSPDNPSASRSIATFSSSAATSSPRRRSPAAAATRLRARVFWLHQRPLAVGGHLTARIGTAETTAVVRRHRGRRGSRPAGFGWRRSHRPEPRRGDRARPVAAASPSIPTPPIPIPGGSCSSSKDGSRAAASFSRRKPLRHTRHQAGARASSRPQRTHRARTSTPTN